MGPGRAQRARRYGSRALRRRTLYRAADGSRPRKLGLSPTRFAGKPAQTSPAGTDRVTTEFAPITAPSPMIVVSPERKSMVAPAPIMTSSPTRIPPPVGSWSRYRYWSPRPRVTPWNSFTLDPKITDSWTTRPTAPCARRRPSPNGTVVGNSMPRHFRSRHANGLFHRDASDRTSFSSKFSGSLSWRVVVFAAGLLTLPRIGPDRLPPTARNMVFISHPPKLACSLGGVGGWCFKPERSKAASGDLTCYMASPDCLFCLGTRGLRDSGAVGLWV